MRDRGRLNGCVPLVLLRSTAHSGKIRKPQMPAIATAADSAAAMSDPNTWDGINCWRCQGVICPDRLASMEARSLGTVFAGSVGMVRSLQKASFSCSLFFTTYIPVSRKAVVNKMLSTSNVRGKRVGCEQVHIAGLAQ